MIRSLRLGIVRKSKTEKRVGNEVHQKENEDTNLLPQISRMPVKKTNKPRKMTAAEKKSRTISPEDEEQVYLHVTCRKFTDVQSGFRSSNT
jgi:hypothetical protein